MGPHKCLYSISHHLRCFDTTTMSCVYSVNHTQWSTHFPEVVLGKEAEILYFLYAARSYETDLCPYIRC